MTADGVDFDINLCHPALLLNKALEILGKTGHWSTLPMLRLYVRHYKAWRKFVASFGGLSDKGVKKALNIIVYFGAPDSDLPFLWALVHDIRSATDVVLNSAEFEYLKPMFHERNRSKATQLFYALTKLDRFHVDHMISNLDGSGSGFVVEVSMFDGFIAASGTGAAGIPAQVEDMIAAYPSMHSIGWKTRIMQKQNGPEHNPEDREGGMWSAHGCIPTPADGALRTRILRCLPSDLLPVLRVPCAADPKRSLMGTSRRKCYAASLWALRRARASYAAAL